MLRKRFLLLFIAAAVGIGLLWIEDYTTQKTQDNINSASVLPDYYGEGLRNRSYTKEGLFERQFIASHSIHYPSKKLTEFNDPEVHSVADNGDIWVMKSLLGFHYEDLKTLLLQQDVLITPLAELNSNDPLQTSIRTSELTLYTEQKLAKTDKPVKVTSADGHIDAVGMIIKLDQQKIEFLSQVKARYAP
ncbi:MAG: LPS export ABC transporter periplasmic protein LptC [Oleispira sp.]|nr:LPS export ABC transporter periplasmic protein LptC [Oleispira sp.]